jgi:hypothetical protein
MFLSALLWVWVFSALAATQNVNRTALTNISIVYDTWAAFEGCLPQTSAYGLVKLIRNDLTSSS